jgi:CRISPR-associated exonuclease Cas4
MVFEFSDVSGVEFCYFFVCDTQLWLFSHGLIKSDEDENVKLGRILYSNRYKKEKREREVFRSKFDVIKIGEEYLIYELKKYAILSSNILQLKFYMYQIHLLTGLSVKGIISAPGKKYFVNLTSEDISFINESINKIKEIKNLSEPPKPTFKPICKKCGYRNFCFGDRYE